MTRQIVVALGCPLSEDRIRRIQQAAPTATIVHLGDLLTLEQRRRGAGDLRQLKQLRREAERALARAEVLLTEVVPPDLPTRAPHLRWVQLPLAGANRAMRPEIVDGPIRVTVARGVLGRTIAEHVLGTILFFSRRFDQAVAAQRKRQWDPERMVPWELGGKRLGVIGFGDIGRHLARLARAFHMKTVAIRRSQERPLSNAGDVDLLLPPSQLHELLEMSDFVTVAVPLTPETRGLIGDAELHRMKPTAYFINVARGEIVDQQALIEALRQGLIAGAALDVFVHEPLPRESPLWSMPNVLITSHVAGPSPAYLDANVDLFCANLARYLEGKPLLHEVNKERWY